MGAAPERAVTRSGKGRPMKALLLKKWGSNYAGQVLTGVQEGSIPSDVARFYKDDEPTPMDVVNEPNPGSTPLAVVNDELNVDEVDAADDAQASKIKAAAAAGVAGSQQGYGEEADTQRRAREADNFAAKGAKKAASDKRTKGGKAKSGKEHGVK